MSKQCDHTSVGVIIRRGGAVLLIERKKYNPGFALPAGHCDGDEPEAGARRETEEEIGLSVGRLEKVLELRLPNPCKREGGDFHLWTVFEAHNWQGEIRAATDEVKSYIWADQDELNRLAERLRDFVAREKLSYGHLPELIAATNASDEWRVQPGLEPPWYILLSHLNMLKMR